MSTDIASDLADLARVHGVQAEVRSLLAAVACDPLDEFAAAGLVDALSGPRLASARAARRRLLEPAGMGEGGA